MVIRLRFSGRSAPDGLGHHESPPRSLRNAKGQHGKTPGPSSIASSPRWLGSAGLSSNRVPGYDEQRRLIAYDGLSRTSRNAKVAEQANSTRPRGSCAKPSPPSLSRRGVEVTQMQLFQPEKLQRSAGSRAVLRTSQKSAGHSRMASALTSALAIPARF